MKEDGNDLCLLTGKPSSIETGRWHSEHLDEGEHSSLLSAVNWALGKGQSSTGVWQRVRFVTVCQHCTQRAGLKEAPVLENYLQPLSAAEQNNNKQKMLKVKNVVSLISASNNPSCVSSSSILSAVSAQGLEDWVNLKYFFGQIYWQRTGFEFLRGGNWSYHIPAERIA